MEENKTKDFEPLEEPTPLTMSFDMKMTPNQFKSTRKLFKNRLPRKFKKRYKNMVAKRFGIKPSKLRFRNNGVFTHK